MKARTVLTILTVLLFTAMCDIATAPAQEKKAKHAYVAPDSGFVRVGRLQMIQFTDQKVEQLKQAYLIQTGKLQGKKELYEKEKKDSLDIPTSELQ